MKSDGSKHQKRIVRCVDDLLRVWHDPMKSMKRVEDNHKLKDGSMTTLCFVDPNHAGSAETRRSQTGILLFCDKAPTVWFSKRQNSVLEAPTFGSEFTAMKSAMEMTEGLRCKLPMFVVPIEGPTNVF